MQCAHLNAEVVVEPRNLGRDKLLGKEALGVDVDFDLLALRGLAGECGADVTAMRANTSRSVTREAQVDAVEDARDVLDDRE